MKKNVVDPGNIGIANLLDDGHTMIRINDLFSDFERHQSLLLSKMSRSVERPGRGIERIGGEPCRGFARQERIIAHGPFLVTPIDHTGRDKKATMAGAAGR
jgi:hypothetical protein